MHLRRIAALGLMLLGACSAAQAAPAPGGARDFAVIAGQPHFAVLSSTGLLSVDGNVLNHDRSQPARQPDIVASGGRLWITWVERVSSGIWQVRVAKQRGDGQLRELAGGPQPITLPGSLGSRDPHIAVHAHQPYVSYIENLPTGARVEVAELRFPCFGCPGGFEHRDLSMPDALDPVSTRIVMSGGVTYVAIGHAGSLSLIGEVFGVWQHLATLDYGSTEGDLANGGTSRASLVWDHHVHAIELTGYTLAGDAGRTFTPTVTELPQDPGVGPGWSALTILNGVRYAAGVTDGKLRIAALRAGHWQPVTPPAEATDHVRLSSLRLLTADGAVWLLWRDDDGTHAAPVP
jgi:hypothetical protein